MLSGHPTQQAVTKDQGQTNLHGKPTAAGSPGHTHPLTRTLTHTCSGFFTPAQCRHKVTAHPAAQAGFHSSERRYPDNKSEV